MENIRQPVVRFPSERIQKPAAGGATRFQIWRGRLREWIGRTLNSAGVPGAIRNVNLKDELSGQNITITVDALYVRLTLNERDYYFNRVTGKFDGTGSSS
jgi:hypothetical protein